MSDNEIFEDSTPSYDLETLADSADEADNEGNLAPEPEPEPPKKKSGYVKKGRKPLSEEQKQRLRENLAKGRAKSLEIRRRKAQLKKIEKADKVTEEEEKIYNNIQRKKQKAKDNDELLKQIEELKAQLRNKEKPAPPPPPPPPQPKETKKEDLKLEVQQLEPQEPKKQPKPKPVIVKPPAPKNNIVPKPPNHAPPPLSKRKKMKMLRGL